MSTIDEPQACADLMDEARLALMRLAALRAQDREDGAREMRERAAHAVGSLPSQILFLYGRPGGPPGNGYRPLDGNYAAQVVRALPLSPARKEDGDA
ncbi:hypothetical protein [Methylorubrum suomiense]